MANEGGEDDDLNALFGALDMTRTNASKLMGKKKAAAKSKLSHPKKSKLVAKKKTTKTLKKSSKSQSSSETLSSTKNLDFTAINKEVFEELNKVRTNPQSLISRIQFIIDHMKGNAYYPPNSRIGLNYKEGSKVLHETIEFLKTQPKVKPMKFNQQLSKAAEMHCKDQSQTGSTGHISQDGKTKPADRMNNAVSGYKWKVTCGENIMYGRENGRDFVAALIIDDGVKSRGHRKNMFSTEYSAVGIASSTHPVYRTMCVLDFAADFVKVDDE